MHPYFTIGQQIVEAYRIHHGGSKKAAKQKAIDMLARVASRSPRAASTTTRTSSPAACGSAR